MSSFGARSVQTIFAGGFALVGVKNDATAFSEHYFSIYLLRQILGRLTCRRGLDFAFEGWWRDGSVGREFALVGVRRARHPYNEDFAMNPGERSQNGVGSSCCVTSQ